jgi:peptidyl-prolyl cis-trans isomerase D
MISWIQRYFQRHFRIVFILLLAAMVIPLVFIYSASGGLGRGGRKVQRIEVFGQSFTSEQDKQILGRDAQISLLLASPYGYVNPNQVEQHVFYRIALLDFANKYHIGEPTQAQLTEFVRSRPMFHGPDGQYDPQQYARFVDGLKTGAMGLSEAIVQHVLAEDWRIEQMHDALQGPGYVPAADIKRSFESNETQWTIHVATLDLTPIQPAAEPSAEDLQRWFEAAGSKYAIPEKIRVDYVDFSAARFLSAVQPDDVSDDKIVAYFDRNKAHYQKPPTPAADGTAPPPAETTLADVRDQVIADMRQARAAHLAGQAASDFAVELFNADVKPGTPEFEKFIADHQLELHSAPPFPNNQPPAGTGWDQKVVNAAFRLSPTSMISQELRAGDDTVILFFRELIPSAPATLESVRDRVLADVRADKRRQAIVARGELLKSQLAAAVRSGKSFDDAAKAAGLEVKAWEKIKPTAPPADFDYSIAQNLDAYKVGEISPMSVQGEKGKFVLVSAKDVPDPSADPAAFARAREDLMARRGREAGNVVLAQYLRKELVASGLEKADETP